MKRVDLVAPPMAGHLHPVLGIAIRLASEPDLVVRVISTPAAQPAISASGLTGIAVRPGADELIARVVEPPYRIGSDPRKLAAQFRANLDLQAGLLDELAELWESDSPDLVIADFTLPVAGSVATRLGLPWWTTHPSPCAIEARSGPPSYLGGLRPGRTSLGRARDAAGRRIVRAFKSGVHRIWRHRLAELGYPRVYRDDGSEAIYSPDRVYALTPPAIEYDRALPAAVRTVGPVLHTPPSDHPAPLLTSGKRHVLVTAGTHLPWHKTALVEEVGRTAGRLPDVEFHVSRGGSDLDVAAPEGVVVHRYVDYARDLPRFDAVVHHGGAGVLGHTLAAGLPAVVLPVDYDQFDHAVRLVDAGVALRPTPGLLANAVREMLDRPSYRIAAERIAAQIKDQPAVEAIAADVRAALF